MIWQVFKSLVPLSSLNGDISFPVSLCNDRPARPDQIEQGQLVKVQRRHFEQRKLRVREGGIGYIKPDQYRFKNSSYALKSESLLSS